MLLATAYRCIWRGPQATRARTPFFAVIGSNDYTIKRVKGVAKMMFGDSGFFIAKFHSHARADILWLHGYGNVFEKALALGEPTGIAPAPGCVRTRR